MKWAALLILSIYFISIVGVVTVFICDYFNQRTKNIYSRMNDEEIL